MVIVCPDAVSEEIHFHKCSFVSGVRLLVLTHAELQRVHPYQKKTCTFLGGVNICDICVLGEHVQDGAARATAPNRPTRLYQARCCDKTLTCGVQHGMAV